MARAMAYSERRGAGVVRRTMHPALQRRLTDSDPGVRVQAALAIACDRLITDVVELPDACEAACWLDGRRHAARGRGDGQAREKLASNLCDFFAPGGAT